MVSKNTELPLALQGQLSHFPAIDLVTLFHESRRSGRLELKHGSTHKKLFFHEGEVVFATSNLEDDRLGESLLRAGRITQEQFIKASEILKKDRSKKLGRILVDEEYLTPGKLWIGVKNQVEEIFFSVLKMKEGEFFFYEGKAVLENSVRLSRSIRSLILDGVRQIDELRVFIEQIIGSDTVFLPLHRPMDSHLTGIEEEIHKLVDGERSVLDLISAASTSPFVTYKVLSNLMLARLIVPRDLVGGMRDGDLKLNLGQTSSESISNVKDWRSLLQRYNVCFQEIQRTAQDAGHALDNDLIEYFADHESPFRLLFADLGWLEEGGLEASGVAERLEELDEGERYSFLNRALEDLLCFLTFKTQGFLPKDVSLALMNTIQEFQNSSGEP